MLPSDQIRNLLNKKTISLHTLSQTAQIWQQTYHQKITDKMNFTAKMKTDFKSEEKKTSIYTTLG